MHRRTSTFGPGARFSKAPESFQARKAILSSSVYSSVSKNGEVYTLETSCMKGISLSSLEYVNKTALYSQGSRFCNGFTGPKCFGGFRETAPWGGGDLSYCPKKISQCPKA